MPAQKTQPTVLAVVPSKSNPEKVYEIRLSRAGDCYCTCPAWVYSKQPKSCKHLREFLTAHPTYDRLKVLTMDVDIMAL